MEKWTVNHLRERNGHLASEYHSRIQVIHLSPEKEAEPFTIEHGELIINVLAGQGRIEVDGLCEGMSKGDQFYLVEEETFTISRIDEAEVTLQFIWMPGISGFCDKCRG